MDDPVSEECQEPLDSEEPPENPDFPVLTEHLANGAWMELPDSMAKKVRSYC